jgi:hypothetical protein
VLGLEVTDDRLDGDAALHLAARSNTSASQLAGHAGTCPAYLQKATATNKPHQITAGIAPAPRWRMISEATARGVHRLRK